MAHTLVLESEEGYSTRLLIPLFEVIIFLQTRFSDSYIKDDLIGKLILLSSDSILLWVRCWMLTSVSLFILFSCCYSAKFTEEKLRYAAYNCVAIDTDMSPWDE